MEDRFDRAHMTVWQKLWQVHWLFVLLLCATAGIGFAMLYSAAGGNVDPWASRQMVRFAFGVVLMVGGNISGETRTISIAIYDRVQAFDNAAAGKMAGVLLLISLVTIALSFLFAQRVGRRHD